MNGHVEVRNFALRYGAATAVSDVSLTVAPGEFVSLIGPSGCGKSTVLNAVAGFIQPTQGRITVDGQPVSGPGAELGMVFQQYSLFPWKTVRKNVEFGLKMKGVPAQERQRTARALLDAAGLLRFENLYPDQLSGGMKQRVGIVRALATQPKVLLLDEPFGALDAQTRLIMQQILTGMWQRQGISVLFVTHDTEEAIFLSDRIYVMTAHPGTIKAEIAVNLPRPRTADLALSPEFARLKSQVQGLIREESIRAMGGEVTSGTLEGAAQAA